MFWLRHKKVSNSRSNPFNFNPSASTSERSISTAQMKLKRARLADDLNEKIALRPGPLELVEKNILPIDSAVKEAIKGSTVNTSLYSLQSEGSKTLKSDQYTHSYQINHQRKWQIDKPNTNR